MKRPKGRVLKSMASICRDGMQLYFPFLFAKPDYAIAFLVHPRDLGDIYKKYPFFRHMPNAFLRFIEHFLWPITVSNISGVKNSSGGDVPGFVISIPMTAKTMLRHRARAKRQIRAALRLARNKGAKIAGLGALTASLSQGGTSLTDISGIAVTTGHAYTGYSVTRYFFKYAAEHNVDIKKCTVAIVGAAGSIGSISAKILARSGVGKLILIDIKRKVPIARDVMQNIKSEHNFNNTIVSDNLPSLKEAHFIITATNAPDALVLSKHVNSGTIIIDDAQPSDIEEDIFYRDDVIVLEAGAVTTPNISTNFDMGLVGRDTNFCCMAEVLILGSKHHDQNHTINRATLEQVDELGKAGQRMGFSVAPYQNMFGSITEERTKIVGDILAGRIQT